MKNWKGGVLAVAITAILLFIYYSHQILGADTIKYGVWGDGYKNYYTLAYYLKYDHGAHFTGMNYPFGENVLFTDNQPSVAWILKCVIKIFPELINHIYAFIVFAFFTGLLISAVVIYKIFREFEVDQFNAALFSTLIVLLSPQMQRLGGHFSLSYTFYIPAMMLLLIRLVKTEGRAKYFIGLLLLNSFFVFVHIYYAAMSGLFVLLLAATYAFFRPTDLKTSFRKVSSLLAIIAIVPFVLLKTFLLITDKISDRPKAPWGFIENRSTVADILLHPYTFTSELIGRLFPHAHIVYHFEGEGYIGLITIVTLFVAAIVCLRSTKIRAKLCTGLYPFNLFIIPAIGIILFALAFPFCIDPIEKYYQKMPGIIKQFRASGRFNWYFYYTATIGACLLLYQLYTYLLTKNKVGAYSLLVLVYGIWFIEDNMISNRLEKDFRANSVELDDAQYAKELLIKIHDAGKQVSDFQAIIPLAFFLNGSEKLYIESSVAYIAMKQSLNTGLPIISCQMSRTSQSQTFEIANLISGPLIKKDVLRFFKNNKPLLLITHGDDLSKEERALLAKGKFLFEQRGNRYLELDLSAFTDSIDETKKYFAQNRSKYLQHTGYFSDDSIANVVIKRFEDEPKDYAVFGRGAHHSEREPVYYYFDTLPLAKDSTIYEVSYWVYTDSRRAAYPVMYISESDTSGKEVSKFDSNGKFSTNIYGNWVRGSIDLTLYNRKNKLLLLGAGDYATFDEVMIRPKNVNVVTQLDNDSTFIFNNFPIR